MVDKLEIKTKSPLILYRAFTTVPDPMRAQMTLRHGGAGERPRSDGAQEYARFVDGADRANIIPFSTMVLRYNSQTDHFDITSHYVGVPDGTDLDAGRGRTVGREPESARSSRTLNVFLKPHQIENIGVNVEQQAPSYHFPDCTSLQARLLPELQRQGYVIVDAKLLVRENESNKAFGQAQLGYGDGTLSLFLEIGENVIREQKLQEWFGHLSSMAQLAERFGTDDISRIPVMVTYQDVDTTGLDRKGILSARAAMMEREAQANYTSVDDLSVSSGVCTITGHIPLVLFERLLYDPKIEVIAATDDHAFEAQG
jgi:hypothetical protein